jgi:hypothetical protein
MSATAQRVYLHVGVPKTGTTFVQTTLAENRARLEEDGVLYPAGKHDLMFRAALDVRGNHQAWGRTRAEVRGSWDDLCRKARRHQGTTVISHELLAAAGPRQISTALSMLAGLEVHVVVTARDPAHQATAEWQEGIKHGRTLTFAEFRERVLAEDSSHAYARRFAAAQDLPAVLARWSAEVPAERVHVVCTPPAGTHPSRLWELFGEAVGLRSGRYPLPDPAALNRSLGVVEIDLLRRVNTALGRRLVQPEYGQVVKQYFAKELLVRHVSRLPTPPRDVYDGLVHVAERWAKEIDRAGYTVHGDLEQLLPTPPAEPTTDPDDVDPRAEVDTAASAIAELLVELESTRARAVHLAAENALLESERKKQKRKRKALKRRLAAALHG